MSSPQGLTVLSAADHSKPWLISGSGRSGTTALARLCAALGLTSLDNGHNTLEHQGMRVAHAERNVEWVRAFRRGWTAGCLVKTPGLGIVAGRDAEMAEALDCNYLFSFRDVVVESFYDTIQHPDANVGEMMRTRANMAALSVSSALVLSQSTGVIMVSYEKLIQPLSNRALVTRLCTLIGGSPDNIDAAMLTISPEDAAYRQRARGGQPAKLPATAANASSSD